MRTPKTAAPRKIFGEGADLRHTVCILTDEFDASVRCRDLDDGVAGTGSLAFGGQFVQKRDNGGFYRHRHPVP